MVFSHGANSKIRVCVNSGTGRENDVTNMTIFLVSYLCTQRITTLIFSSKNIIPVRSCLLLKPQDIIVSSNKQQIYAFILFLCISSCHTTHNNCETYYRPGTHYANRDIMLQYAHILHNISCIS